MNRRVLYLLLLCERHYGKGLLLIIATLGLVTPGLVLSTTSAAAASDPPVYLPACGGDPNVNTRALQMAINNAAPGSTLVLPAGECLLAKCAIAQGAVCYNSSGDRYNSAVDIGNKSDLTLAGASDGTSVLKLDPNPPRSSDGYHGYCGDTHVLSIQGSSFITLRDFTIDGSDGELPEDTNQCLGGGGRIAEHMHGVLVQNSTDITVDRMKLIKAHGDALYLIANRGRPIPRTERISVTNTDFLDNDRSGLTFQRNVGYVTVRGNYFRNSGEDQDLDMEPTGDQDDLGPYEVEIDDNLFERTRPGITVSLGASSTQRTTGVRFTNNTIRPAGEGEGGCIFVNSADYTTIANNRIIGGQNCVPLQAQRVTDLLVENNYLEGHANLQNAAGTFLPQPVIRIAERIVNRGDPQTCGAPPRPPCPYIIHYPDRIMLTGNAVVQQVQRSPVIELSNPDELWIAGNTILHTHSRPPVGTYNPALRPIGINIAFGVRDLPSYGYYLNEKTEFERWAIDRNELNEFADGIRINPIKVGVFLGFAILNDNLFNTRQSSPRGIWLEGAPTAPESGFIRDLIVDSNRFGCGFPGEVPPPHAFERPGGQAHTGNIGVTVPCK